MVHTTFRTIPLPDTKIFRFRIFVTTNITGLRACTTFTSCLPISASLYCKNVTNIPQPLSLTDLPKFRDCAIAFISRSSIGSIERLKEQDCPFSHSNSDLYCVGVLLSFCLVSSYDFVRKPSIIDKSYTAE